jgi:hypothetical protein
MYKQPIIARERTLGPDDISTLDVIKNLGINHLAKIREPAQKHYKRHSKVMRRILGASISRLSKLGLV